MRSIFPNSTAGVAGPLVLLGLASLFLGHGLEGGGPMMMGGIGVFWYGKPRQNPWWKRAWGWVQSVFGGGTVPLDKEDLNGEAEFDVDRLLHRMRRQLREASEESVGLLAATVHDLKTPLLGIRELSGLVLENEPLSDDARRKLELIHTSSDEAMGRVDELLTAVTDAADEEEKDPELAWETVNLCALAERIVERHRPHAEYKDQILHCDLPSETYWVEGDQLRLREAASNLVSNALKYSPPKETIAVQVRRHGDSVRFSVTDNGPGLSETDRSRLFRPFQQLSARPTGNEGSSGVGLYVTKQIMDLHDGEIEVTTAEGEGSTFALVWPVVSSETETAD